MSSVQVLLSIKDESLRRKAVDALRESSNNVSFEQHDSDWSSLLERLVKVKPEALLLDVGSVPTDLAIAIRQVKLQAPRTKIVALHAVDDPKIILAAMRAGANEFLHPPFEESLTLETTDLVYRPVWAYEFHWKPKDKRGVVEIDAVTGAIRAGSSALLPGSTVFRRT